MNGFVLLVPACLFQLPIQSPPLSWDGSATTISTVIIAGAAVVNLVVAILLWKATAGSTKITRDIFEASHRPYVGVVSARYLHTESSQKIEILLKIKNTGTIPAVGVTSRFELLANHIQVAVTGPETKPLVIFPGTTRTFGCKITDAKEYKDTVKALLDLEMSIDYSGLEGKQYHHQSKWMRHPDHDRFALTGATST
jgi:hypothetical protein